MKRRKINIAVLYTIAGVLLITSCAVVYADSLLWRIFKEQQKNMQLLTQASNLPVLQPASASPEVVVPALQATPTLSAPVRKQLVGDIANVRFPEYDTGQGAEYSYQSDELRIAVNEVKEDGVTYYVADIWMRNINCFRTAFSSGKFRGKRESAEKISQDNNAILAVNGDFLGGLVLRNGELHRKATLRLVPLPAEEDLGTQTMEDLAIQSPEPTPTPIDRPQRATCVLYYDGTMVTEEYGTFRSVKALERGAWQGWQFGPTLVRNGNAVKDVKAQGRNPRCVLGYYEPGHYCLILIDGRRKGHSIGMNFKEIIELCTRLGLVEAYNLDGGGSAIMTYNGKIINQPSGSEEARSLADMVVIGEYLTPDMLFVPTPSPMPKTTPASAQLPEDADIENERR